jgi:hypothetical protein
MMRMFSGLMSRWKMPLRCCEGKGAGEAQVVNIRPAIDCFRSAMAVPYHRCSLLCRLCYFTSELMLALCTHIIPQGTGTANPLYFC